MLILKDFQIDRLRERLLKHKDNNPNACVINITLTFRDEDRKRLKEEDNGFLRAYNRFMLKLAKANKCHCWGWFAMESLSFSMKTNQLVGEHCHILCACVFDSIAPMFDQIIVKDLWPFANEKETVVQFWDGKTDLLDYNYGLRRDHFHNTVPTRVYHPRRKKCRDGDCEICNSFPTPEQILNI